MDPVCKRCEQRIADSAFTDLCSVCVEELNAAMEDAEGVETPALCDVCESRPGRSFPGLDGGCYCRHCVPTRAAELGVDINPSALKALEFLSHLQEKLCEVQVVLQERVCMLNEDVTGYVHQRSEHCLALLQVETQRTQQRYVALMSRLQQMGEHPTDSDDEAMDQVRVPGLLKRLSTMVLHRVNIQTSVVNQAMTRALMGECVFFSELVEIVEFWQRQEE